MRRFDLEDIMACGQPWREMQHFDSGDWVPWEDAKAEIDALNARIKELTNTIERISDLARFAT